MGLINGGTRAGGLRNLSEIAAIPDSGDLQTHYISSKQPENDSDVVDPYLDQNAGDDAAAIGNPLLQTGIINNKDVTRYDGADDGHNVSGTVISQPLHIMCVAQVNSLSTGQSKQAVAEGGNGTDRCIFRVGEDVTQWEMFAGSLLQFGTADTNPHVFNAYFDGANSYLRVDGTEIGTGDPGGSDLSIISLGYNPDSGGRQFFQGDIGELAIHNSTLSSSAETDWENYLSDKYAITI